MNNPVKISVVTASFNSQETIAAAIASLHKQTYSQREHVVVDGSSSDGTVEIARRMLGQGDRLLSEKDSGIYDALNKGIREATGEVVGFLHSDDLFASNEVLQRVAAQFEDPDIDAVYGDLQYVSASDPSKVIRYWRSGNFTPSKLRNGWMPPHPTFFMRRKLYEELGGFDLSYRIASDYDSLVRYLGRGGVRPAYIPEVLVKMRVGGVSNRSLKNIVRKSWEDARAMRKNGINPWRALIGKNISKVIQFFPVRQSVVN